MASPFFFISKKDGKLRPCQDYRYLNNWTIKNSYPLPLISDILDKLKGAKYFTKLDVWWGYNNICIHKEDEWKAAFKTNKGLFKPTVMFFSMCNSPVTFQTMMDDIFTGMIDEKLVIIYMDDILIFAKTKEELERITKMVLAKLRKHDLFLKAKKCEFCKLKIEYLGMIIEEGKISMDPIKLAGIRDWPTPSTEKQVRSFLGFGNFYQKFISHYSDIAKPLNDLTKKDKKFEWNNKCQESFDTLKRCFTKEPVLLMPDHSKLFQIESDASKSGNWSCTHPNRFKWRQTPCSFLISDIYGHRTTIWNIRLKTLRNHLSIERMVTLYPRIWTHDGCTFWPQELDIFQNRTEIKQPTSTMVTVSFWIRYKTDTYARNKNNTIRFIILTSGSWDRWINRKRESNTTPR